MEYLRIQLFVTLGDRALRLILNFLALTLVIVLAATGYLFDEPDVEYKIGQIHWFGWVVFGCYVAMGLLALCTTQLPRYLTMRERACRCNRETWSELVTLVGGAKYRSALSNWTQGVVLLALILIFSGSTLVLLLHCIIHMLLWGLESIVYPVLFSIYVFSMMVSSLADANRHAEYVTMYAPQESPLLLHRLSCYRTLFGTVFMPILGIALLAVAFVR